MFFFSVFFFFSVAFLASSFFFIFLASLGCAFTQLSPGEKILGEKKADVGHGGDGEDWG